MSFKFIRDHVGRWPIRLMCRVHEVSASGYYYAWRNRPESARAHANRALLAELRRLHAEHHGRYGSPRMHAALRAEGGTASRGRIARLMRCHGIRALAGRSSSRARAVCRHSLPIAPNLLKQEFVAAAPNRVWLADITYIATGKGWLYLAALLDLATRMIVCWSMRDHMRAELPLAALMMGAQRQRPSEGSICHSDRGSQYAFEAYVKLLIAMKAKPSISRTACCYDNAPWRASSTAQGRTRPPAAMDNASRHDETCSRISRATITDAGSTQLSDIEPRNRPNDKWPNPVSAKAGDYHRPRSTRFMNRQAPWPSHRSPSQDRRAGHGTRRGGWRRDSWPSRVRPHTGKVKIELRRAGVPG